MGKLIWALVALLLVSAGAAAYWLLLKPWIECSATPSDITNVINANLLDFRNQPQDVLAYRLLPKEANETAEARRALIRSDLVGSLLNDTDWFIEKVKENPGKSFELFLARDYLARRYIQAAFGAGEISEKTGGMKNLSDSSYGDIAKALNDFNQTWAGEYMCRYASGLVGADGWAGDERIEKSLTAQCACGWGTGAARYVNEYLKFVKSKIDDYRGQGEFTKAAIYEVFLYTEVYYPLPL